MHGTMFKKITYVYRCSCLGDNNEWGVAVEERIGRSGKRFVAKFDGGGHLSPRDSITEFETKTERQAIEGIARQIDGLRHV